MMRSAILFTPIRFCVLILVIFSVQPCLAQRMYEHSIGLRWGRPTSVSYKGFISEQEAVEVYLGTRRPGSVRYTSLGASFLHHWKASELADKWDLDLPEAARENMNCYLGAGAAAYLWSYGSSSSRNGYGLFSWGLQGHAGAEYKFKQHPLVVGVEWNPRWLLGEGYYQGLSWRRTTFTLRYLLK